MQTSNIQTIEAVLDVAYKKAFLRGNVDGNMFFAYIGLVC
jgi:hypothetical protein